MNCYDKRYSYIILRLIIFTFWWLSEFGGHGQTNPRTWSGHGHHKKWYRGHGHGADKPRARVSTELRWLSNTLTEKLGLLIWGSGPGLYIGTSKSKHTYRIKMGSVVKCHFYEQIHYVSRKYMENIAVEGLYDNLYLILVRSN